MKPQILYSQQLFKNSKLQKARYWAQPSLNFTWGTSSQAAQPQPSHRRTPASLWIHTTKSTQVLRAPPLTFISTHCLNRETHPEDSAHTNPICTYIHHIQPTHVLTHKHPMCACAHAHVCVHTHMLTQFPTWLLMLQVLALWPWTSTLRPASGPLHLAFTLEPSGTWTWLFLMVFNSTCLFSWDLQPRSETSMF